MTIVLADDITGAAEIAGTALRYGLKASFLTADADIDDHDSDIVVVATDIRSQTANEARRTTEELCRKVKKFGDTDRSGRNIGIFKKTDSALRGHISLELNTIMDILGFNKALLIAQNPSKGRVIKDSTYYVGGTLLSQTMFAKDPEFPAESSVPTRIVGGNCRILKIEERLHDSARRIFIAEASTTEDVETQIKKADESTIIAGGADSFEAYIRQTYKTAKPQKGISTPLSKSPEDTILVVSGSTQAKSIMGTRLVKEANGIELTIPDNVFEGADETAWTTGIRNECQASDVVVVRIGKHEFKGADYGNRLKGILAKAAGSLINARIPRYLIIEGGATAFAILSELRWNRFDVIHEYSPGVVGLKHEDTEIILKPGSYDWGNLFC